MFHDDERVASFREAMEQADQARNVFAVQAGRRLVEEQERARFARINLGKVADQLEALGLATGKSGERLAHREIAEADFFQAGELGGGRCAFAQELTRLGHGHREQVADGLAVIVEAQYLVAEALTITGGAGEGDVGDELHLHRLPARAAAAFAATFAGVKGEVRGREAGGLRLGRVAEQCANRVPSTNIESGVGAWRACGGRLVDERDLGRLLIELHPFQFLGFVA